MLTVWRDGVAAVGPLLCCVPHLDVKAAALHVLVRCVEQLDPGRGVTQTHVHDGTGWCLISTAAAAAVPDAVDGQGLLLPAVAACC